MRHKISIEGVAYRLRPITVDDAALIVDLRLKNQERTQYINPISPSIDIQRSWLEEYYGREGDYYFVIESRLTGEAEGLIGIYDVSSREGEWGRWVLKKGSLASIESVDLIFKVAFNVLRLDELYCRTIQDNKEVVAFHNNLPQMVKCSNLGSVTLNGVDFDVIEHYVSKDYYFDQLQERIQDKSTLILQRNLKDLLGVLEFHHIGVATSSITSELNTFQLLGYRKDGDSFEDLAQGVKGLFITANGQPRLELLENLPGSNTLDIWLDRKVKNYHFAYKVHDFDLVVEVLSKLRIRLVGRPETSVYFGKRICFLILPNLFLIEIIEI